VTLPVEWGAPHGATPLLVAALVLGAFLVAGRARVARCRDRARALVGKAIRPPGVDRPALRRWAIVRRRSPGPAIPGALAPRWSRIRSVAVSVGSGGLGAALGLRLAGPPGLIVIGLATAAAPIAWSRRSARRSDELVERQLAEATESIAVALRSGLSVSRALEHAAAEAEPPFRSHLDAVLEERRLGIPLEAALDRFAEGIGSDDARLLVAVMSLHARSGGDLGAALEDVLATIRHRLAVRRELRGLTAQGRLSALVLGAVPLGFFLFLAVTSQRDLGPVYRSAAGTVMVLAGLALEGLAFLWIRRILRVEV
jgi:tight adherence protein B